MSVCYYPRGVNDKPVISEYDKSGKPIRSTENLVEGLHWLDAAIAKAEQELDYLRRDKKAALEAVEEQSRNAWPVVAQGDYIHFTYTNSIYIVARVEPEKCCLINLRSGERYTEPVSVKEDKFSLNLLNTHTKNTDQQWKKITRQEALAILGEQ